jgi:cytochrome P450
MAEIAPLQQDRVPPSTRQPLPVRIWRGVRDPLGFLQQLEAEFGDIVMLREGRFYAIFSPEYIRHVLQENNRNYQKGPKYRAALAPLMGNGLFTSEGQFWLRQRRLAQPAFHRRNLESLTSPAESSVDELLRDWNGRARRNEPAALREELTELTVRITLRSLFSADADAHLPTLVPAIHAVNDQMHLASVFLPVHLPKWVSTPGRRRFARAIATIDDFVYRVIAERRRKPADAVDLVSLLLAARDENTGEHMDDRQLRDELVTMLNAGHDTVTDAITWTLVLLAQHPEHRARARQEVQGVLNGRPPTAASMAEMPFLGRVFHESLRLYPPGWGFARTAIAEDRLDGFRIPAGSLVVMSPYVMHRSPRYWDHPRTFDPDRFLPERSESRPKFVYFPFGGGPRLCIGAGLASLEAPLIVASILQKIDFDLPAGGEVATSPRISLRPKGTVWLRLRPLAERLGTS